MNSLRQLSVFAAFVVAGASPVLVSADTTPEPDKSMTCAQMMDKAKPLFDSISDPTRKGEAQKEMDLARMNMDKGKKTLCKRHAQKALDLMGGTGNGAG